MSAPRLLDHVVIAGPDLADLVSWFAERTGVVAAPGGAHPTGTANALVALTVDGQRGPRYVELISPDPDRVDDVLPTAFGLPELTGPAVVAYAVHPDDIDAAAAAWRAAGYDPGEVGDLSRRTPDGTLLEWRLTRTERRRADVPFLIDWGGTPHPGEGDLPTLEFVSFARVEPDPEPVRALLAAIGEPEDVGGVVEGEKAGYRLELRRGDGAHVVL
ncbi:VOC family protein [Microbacterium sp. gxy059]|uniref:VOC family protein n=1 Tax=Microbacterium sp. gxy059 TaxID=2957199 RepID=UPI003D963C1E